MPHNSEFVAAYLKMLNAEHEAAARSLGQRHPATLAALLTLANAHKLATALEPEPFVVDEVTR